MKPQIAPIGNYRKTARCLIRREERNFEFIKSINLLMVTLNRVRQYLIVSATAITAFSCSARLLETDPDILTDTSKVTITCDGSEGNAGLQNYSGEVYVHLGLITSKSEHKDDWRYVKFTWGSMQQEARAVPAGKNRWSYPIYNVRKFFGVPDDERIKSLAILFRSGACLDVYCKVLRNSDGSNLYIPVEDKTVIARR
jgi:hypothetical protein